jgi:hypothetical protein
MFERLKVLKLAQTFEKWRVAPSVSQKNVAPFRKKPALGGRSDIYFFILQLVFSYDRRLEH